MRPTKEIVITVKKRRNGFSGKSHSVATKEKISIAKKGKAVESRKKLDSTQREMLRKDELNGMAVSDLSRKYGVSRKTVYSYLREV